MSRAVLFLALGSLLAPVSMPDELDAAWAALDRSSEAEWAQRYAAVLAGGEDAARRGMETFAEADAAGRLTRAELLASSGGPACVELTLAHLEDPDPNVRLALVRFLGQRKLVGDHAAERLAALVSLAVEDSDPAMRSAAIEAVAAIDHPASLERLDGLIDVLVSQDRSLAAQKLAAHAGGRGRVVQRVAREFGGSSQRPLDSTTLAILLESYGQALVHLPGGGESAHERRPLVAGREHGAPIVRLAAARALDRLIVGLGSEGELERAYAVIDGLIADGYSWLDAEYRRANLSLTTDPSPTPARAAARAILAGTRPRGDVEGREWRARGALLGAAAECAAGEFEAARALLAEADQTLEGLQAERPELLPSVLRPAKGNVDQAVALGLERCVVDLWRALTWLAEGRAASDGELLALLRGMHVRALGTQLLSVRYNGRLATSGFQPLIDHVLGPRRLLLSNSESTRWPPARGLALQARLGEALAGVSAMEMPGFTPASTEEVMRNPLADPQRRRLLERIHQAAIEALQVEITQEWDREEPDEAKITRLRYYQAYLFDEARKLREGSDAPLLRLRDASIFALDLSFDLRADGSAAEARELSERMKRDVFAGAALGGGTVSELLVARLEISVGSSWMDEDEPEKAEQAFLQAETRLAAYEESQLERVAGGKDEELEFSLAGLVAGARSLRADVLLSLAVNANVRQRDPDKALEYFERSFELKRSDFMRTLLACYRARSGRAAEARAVLAEIEPTPSLYYNLACTHALLGDLEPAVDYLARDLEVNHASERSRQRQRDWAREDPDLKNLRGHPRFRRIVASDD